MIEAATPGDCRLIAELHVRAWQESYRGLLPDEMLGGLSVEERESMWHAAILDGVPTVLIARLADGIAGFIAFGPSRDAGASLDTGEVWAFYVDPRQWSRGIGSELWRAALARMAGFSVVTLWVLANNVRAIRFYMGRGMVEEPGATQQIQFGGESFAEVRLTIRR